MGSIKCSLLIYLIFFCACILSTPLTLFRRRVATVCSIITLSHFPSVTFAYDESTYLDFVTKSSGKPNEYDINEAVPSRKVVISTKDLELITPPSDEDSLENVLRLIPSYKYFKLISKEYSSRSASYQEGQENLLAPFQ
jgi:hypothetical protein